MASILVTGGAGFVGSHISCGIAAKHPDWKIVAIDNLRRRGSEHNLERLKKSGARFMHGDVRNPSDWPQLPGGPDVIVDCAAEPSVFSGLDDNPRYVVESNLGGTYNCLEYARRRKSGVIFISTSRTYPITRLESLPLVELGTRFDLPQEFTDTGISYSGVTENIQLEGVRSLYGCTKLASELLLQEYGAAYGLKFIIDRCGTITGPGQMGRVEQGVFALWAAAHYFKTPLSYMSFGGRGKQLRDFLHIYDFVALIERQIQCMDKLSGEIFNVGGGRQNSLSLIELTDLCRRVTKNTAHIDSAPGDRRNDIRWYISDLSKVSSLCGWAPERDTEEMAKDILEWLRADERRLAEFFAP